MKLADVAYNYCIQKGIRILWYGCIGDVAEIYSRYGGKAEHPLNRSAAVIGACAKSDKFSGGYYIEHLGRRYNAYEIID